MTRNNKTITYETPAVEVLLFEPEGVMCSSPISGGATNEGYGDGNAGGGIDFPDVSGI